MIPIEYELKDCKLLDMETNEVLLVFDARAIRERTESGGWAGTGIMSGSHSYGIATAAEYNFEPSNHAVEVGKQRYVIVKKHPITPRRVGEQFAKARAIETVLELE